MFPLFELSSFDSALSFCHFQIDGSNYRATAASDDSITSGHDSSMSSERVSMTLNDLCDELLVQIFSYLPIKEKAKIERGEIICI